MIISKRNILGIFLVIAAVFVIIYREKNRITDFKNYLSGIQVEKINYERNVDEREDVTIFSFAIIGSTDGFMANKGKFLKSAAEKIKETNADLVFAMGNLVPDCDGEKGCENNLNSWKKIMEPLLPITYEVMGIHDRTASDRADAIWRSEFNLPINGPDGYDKLTYSFNYGNSHFVVIDTEKPRQHSASEVQLDWLDYDLGSNDKENTFVFFSEPAFPTSAKTGESLDASPVDRDKLWKIIDAHNVTAVFNGNENLFSRRIIDNHIFSQSKNSIHQFVIGNTDALNEDSKSNDQVDYAYFGKHYAIVDVDGMNLTLNLYDTNGTLVHSYSFSK
jgi:acid phosphatase type 7